MIVRHIRVGRDVGNQTVATIRLSADKEAGPHLDFVADALTFQIAAALTRAAKEVRARGN